MFQARYLSNCIMFGKSKLWLIAAGMISNVICASTAVVYPEGEGIGAGKHIVFLASDHEYRAEETCPALARVLSKHHGFKCTVVFGVGEDGCIEAGSSNVEGLSALRSADAAVIFARFLDLPDHEMAELDGYLQRGGPIVGLRTSSHAFLIDAPATYEKYDFESSTPGFEKGFGHQILGNTWVGHYGANHRQATRITLAEGKEAHPILRGVKSGAYCYAGAYRAEVADDFEVLAYSQPMESMEKDAPVLESKPPQATSWTRHYAAKDGSLHRVFHSTQGASEDILDDDYRRMMVNGIIWAAGLEDQITDSLEMGLVGDYQPNTFGVLQHSRNTKPSDLAGFDGPVVLKGTEHKPDASKFRESDMRMQDKMMPRFVPNYVPHKDRVNKK